MNAVATYAPTLAAAALLFSATVAPASVAASDVVERGVMTLAPLLEHKTPTHLGRLRSRFLLPQDRDDLLFRESRSLPRPVLPLGRTLESDGGKIGGRSKPTV
jgi:hypothetical protein